MSYQPKPIGSKMQILLGMFDYYFKPKLRRKQGGPFNGQVERQKIFGELIAKIKFSHVVETGTFRGLTTQYMYRQSGIPVLSSELNPRFYSYAKRRLQGDRHVRLLNLDSRVFLKTIVQSGEIENGNSFFYLDAHWADDLPLLEEMQIIFSEFPDAVVMVDDFEVPDDSGYGYDNYGNGKALTLEYLASALAQFDLQPFFPAIPSTAETGAHRGCVVLVRTSKMKALLKQCKALRELIV